jgi:hypothetical protein
MESLFELFSGRSRHEKMMLLNGRILSRQNSGLGAIETLAEAEFSVFSQWGDDGIIQWLLRHIRFPNQTFIEFGVEDYRESNTRFLMMNNNWNGLVIDGSSRNIARITGSEYFWKYDLQALSAFITAENINELILKSGFDADVGILHIDLDGNDYWVWKAIHVISPIVVIVEYNSVFGPDRAITVPYDPMFQRTRAHPSNLYAGASLKALKLLADEKGYSFIGCNSAGNNAYFVRNDHINEQIKNVSESAEYINSLFRESRSKNGLKTHLSGDKRLEQICGLPIINVQTGGLESL